MNNQIKFLTTKEVLERYKISPATLSRWRKNLGFPEPIINRRHYLIDAIDAWDEQQNKAA